MVVAGCGGGGATTVATSPGPAIPVTVAGAFDLPLSSQVVPLTGDHAFAVVEPKVEDDHEDDEDGHLRIGRATAAQPLDATRLGAATRTSWSSISDVYAHAVVVPVAEPAPKSGTGAIGNSADDPADSARAVESHAGLGVNGSPEILLSKTSAPVALGAALLVVDASQPAADMITVGAANMPSGVLALAVRGEDGRASAWAMSIAAAASHDDEDDDDEEDEDDDAVTLEIEEGEVYVSSTDDYYSISALHRDDEVAESLKAALDRVGGEAQVDVEDDVTLAELVRVVDMLVTLGATSVRLVAPGEGYSSSIFGSIGSGFDDADIYGGLLGDGDPDGSAGGFGPGGGGTGWGTIGTGRYGTIGTASGSGYGVGVGVGVGRTAVVHAVKVGTPIVKGQLDVEIIKRYIKRNLSKISYCYEKELLAQPSIGGALATAFEIGSDGKVTAASAKGIDGDVESCVAGVIKSIEFPKPSDSKPVSVSYPFTMTAPAATP